MRTGILVLMLLLLETNIYAQSTLNIFSADSVGSILGGTFSSRSAALGEANIADTYDLSMVDVNPASISHTQKFMGIHISSRQSWNNNLMAESTTFPILAVGNHTMATQLIVQHPGSSSLNYTDQPINATPEIRSYQANVAYSILIKNSLSLGILNNISYTQVNKSDAQFWTYNPVFGLIYKPTASVSYGMVFKGLGRTTEYQIDPQGNTLLTSINLQESLEIGATFRFPEQIEQSYFSFSLSNQKFFGDDGLWYKGGIEVLPLPFLALRTGIHYNPTLGVTGARFGIGYQTSAWGVNYYLINKQTIQNRQHGLTLSYHF